MRFRLLSNEELEHLEVEFKQFLIVNHIHSDEWIQINAKEPEKALALVEFFSDTVLLKVYEKMDFLEFRSKNLFSVYQILSEKIQAIHVASEDETISLEDDKGLSLAINSSPSKLTIYRGEKQVNPFKEDEIHQLVEKGCITSNELIWQQLSEILKTST
jgi:hypothetical protein